MTLTSRFISLSVSLIFFVIMGFASPVFAQNDLSTSTSLRNLIATIQSPLSTTPTLTSHQTITIACNNLKSVSSQFANYQYDYEHSVFINLICAFAITRSQDGNKDKTATQINTDLQQILKTKTIHDTGLICPTTNTNSNTMIIPHQCISLNDENIDYQWLFYNLITRILNEITNLGYARIYGAANTTNNNTKELSEAYINQYFSAIASKDGLNQYPDTKDYLKRYLTLGKRLQRQTQIISPPENTLPPSLVGRSDLLQTAPDNIGSTTDHTAMINLMYNELFFYTLLSSIDLEYKHKQWKSYDAIPITMQNTNDNRNYLVAINKYKQQTAAQQTILMNTVDDTIKELNEMQARFPIHIALKMYEESVLKLRNTFAKIYLPLHQLHYKLENVQSKN